MVIKILNLKDQVLANTTTIQSLNTQVGQINNNLLSLTTNLTSLTNNLNQLTGEVNGMKVNLTSLVSLYQPINTFLFNNLTFTDGAGNTASGEFHGVWYQPIKLLPDSTSNDGVDLKFLLLVLRGINIPKIPQNGNYFYSNPLPLPLPFVNNNTLRVFWQSAGSGDLMSTIQANYLVENIQINNWALLVQPVTNNGINSACFIVMYI
jgi:hypothetical protein